MLIKTQHSRKKCSISAESSEEPEGVEAKQNVQIETFMLSLIIVQVEHFRMLKIDLTFDLSLFPKECHCCSWENTFFVTAEKIVNHRTAL